MSDDNWTKFCRALGYEIPETGQIADVDYILGIVRQWQEDSHELWELQNPVLARSSGVADTTALIKGLRVAMLGTTDGDFIEPNSEIPAGEMFRLASEYLEGVADTVKEDK